MLEIILADRTTNSHFLPTRPTRYCTDNEGTRPFPGCGKHIPILTT